MSLPPVIDEKTCTYTVDAGSTPYAPYVPAADLKAAQARIAALEEALREIGDLADVDADHRSVIARAALAESGG